MAKLEELLLAVEAHVRAIALIVGGLVVLSSACTGRPDALEQRWPFAGKARVTNAPQAMVVSANPIASEIGRDILRQGGNAVDAAVAVGFALAVVHPEAGNIGGGGFMVIRQRDGTVRALDYRETAPARATRHMFLDSTGAVTGRGATGHLAAGVPGSVAGLVEAHRKHGQLPLATLVEPARRLAEDGFVLDSVRTRSILEGSARLALFVPSRAVFLPNGKPPAAGTTFRQSDLAATLRAIRDSGAAGFYRGWVADSIVAEMDRNGGLISRADLAAYRAVWRDPIKLSYRGYTIYSMPPVSSGGVTMGQILNIVEGHAPLPPFGSVALMHLESEAMRRAFIDRNTLLGDPAFVSNPVDRLLSKDYAASLMQQINARATPTGPVAVDSSTGVSTTHYSVVDADGNAVSTTTTLNDPYGSAVTVRGAGILLNNEMDDFASAPGRVTLNGMPEGEANAIAPGKRMLSSMTPSIVLDPRGELYLVVGTPGGRRIITMVYHVISNVIDHKMSLADAVAAPRLHHQALPDNILLEENSFASNVLDSLRARGHTLTFRPPSGDVQAIIRTSTGWQGVNDPRGGGGGAGY